jgi:tetratricopeptide (TPR) repeat protein
VPPGERIKWPVRVGASPPLADGFIGRPETAPDLRTVLAPGSAVALVPSPKVAGTRSWLGSCGKTQLAVAAAESAWKAGAVDFLAWITATSRESVLSGYVEAAVAAMGIPADGDAESMAVRLLSWLDETDRSWLLVLDDLTDPADLAGLWPAGASGRVLVTTTDPATVAARPEVTLVPVGVFSSREGLSYLMGRLTADPDQRLGAIDLTEDLRCEPLALTHASAVIANSAQTCRDYRDYFARRLEQFTAASGGDLPAAAVTWTLSIDYAERLSPGAVEPLLAVAALLDGNAIPAGVFTALAVCEYLATDGMSGPDPKRAWDGVQSLERVGLLSIDRLNGLQAIRVSAIVQAAVRAAMPDKMLEQAVRAAADALFEVWPETEPPGWLAISLRSCVASLRRAAGEALTTGSCHRLLMRAGQSLDQARLTGSAVAYWSELAALTDRTLGPGHPDTLEIGQRLAAAYLAAGHAGEAVQAFQRILASRLRAAGADHPSVLTVQIQLGRALIAAGETGDAATVLGQAALVCERARGPSHPGTLSVQEELATAYTAAERFSEAIPVYRRTLAARERVQGPGHPDTITTRERLADIYLADGQIKAAISQYKKALADCERAAGPDHLDTVAARSNLASAYFTAGRMASALQLFEKVRADSERLLGEDHPDTLGRRASLAQAYYSAGRLTAARTLLLDTLARCERVLPSGDPLTQAVRESLGSMSAR